MEIYYQMFKSEMETSAKDTVLNNFDGSLLENSLRNLSDIAEKHDISNVSRSLAELLAALEWHNEKKSPQIQETAIYNGLLRLEKALNSTSSWEIYGNEYDGPLVDLSTFEINMIEQTLSMYVVDMLLENSSQTLFFPLTDLYQSDVIIKWRILEKIASIKLFPQETIYKQKLTNALSKRIQGEVQNWFKKECQQLKLSGKNTVLKDSETLTKIIKELKSQVTMCIDVIPTENSLFEAASCDYFDCIFRAINEKLHPVCTQIMNYMDIYQEYYKSFHVNLRESCVLSHALYLQIKKLVCCLQIVNKKSEYLKFEDYSLMFIKCFMNLLQVMKLECHYRIKRAAGNESKDSVLSDEGILSSSVIVLNCICTVIDEWKHMEIEDEDLQVAFLIKISDIICDGAKIFAETLSHRLHNYESQGKESNFIKKMCILVNSVEHVREYLQELPTKMRWKEIASILSSSSKDHNMSEQILRILNLIHQSMNTQLQQISQTILEQASSNLLVQCEKYLFSWIRTPLTNQAFDKVQSFLNEHLELLHDTIKETLFPKFLCLVWSSILTYFKKEFLEGELPEYADILKLDLENLKDYFYHINMETENQSAIWQEILSIIDLNSKSTEELQLEYYSHVAESLVSPVEYLGHIAFQAGYKITGNDHIDLYIHVQKGQRLPARSLEMSTLYVKLALCPPTMFPNHVPQKTSTVTEDLDNPIFNELFQFSKLPTSVLSVKGAVVQLHIVNQDNSYSAEAILLLKQIQNMSGFSSIEFLPVYLVPLKKFDSSQITFQVLENRSRWDKSAKYFINSRVKVSKNRKKFLPCIPGKKVCFL